MNKYLIFGLFCMCFICCDNDSSGTIGDEIGNESTYNLSYTVYENSLLGNTYFVNPNDTLQLAIGDTILLSIIPLADEGSDFVKIESLNKLGITQFYTNQYLCAAIKTGQTPVLVNYGYESFIFNVNVCPSVITYYACESPVYIVDTENVELKSHIQAELEELYNPMFLKKYKLSFTEINGGILEIIPPSASDNIISGTFRTDREAIVFSYNDAEYRFILKESGKNLDIPSFYVNLTEEYRSKYPSEVLNEVSVTITALNIGN